ncbi:MAG: hypothetical protein ACLVL7_10530 [Anaerotruncus massiliensis (ex Togo et al. 2019)]
MREAMMSDAIATTVGACLAPPPRRPSSSRGTGIAEGGARDSPP